MPPSDTRPAAHRVADLITDYLSGVGRYDVFPNTSPGDVRRALPSAPPSAPETLDAILDDYESMIVPNITHWNHPRFFAYFSITGSAPGVLGEALAAVLNLNGMVWRSSPALTELEELVCDWVRQMLDLPEAFVGHINDTASMSTFLALAAARHRATNGSCRTEGLAGRRDLPPLTLYASEESHSSVEKAAIGLGFGSVNVRRIATDEVLRLRVDALEQAIRRDQEAGCLPTAVVATVGTTSTTTIDPVDAIGTVCRREGLWLHVDAAYAGSAAVCPEYRELMRGIETADSIVVNPHKWMFTPVDCSLLYVRDPQLLKETFSLVPPFLRTPESGVTNLMDYGLQLGRRFRALKLWMVIRAFGVQGIQARIRHHCALAQEFAAWVDESPDFEVVVPVPFSLVCLRAITGESTDAEDRLNAALVDAVNRTGRVFLSATEVRGRPVIRVAIGNLRTERADLEELWALLQRTARDLRAS